MKLTQTIGKHWQVTLADLLHQNLKNNLSGSLLLDLDPGECAPLEQLDNHLGPPHVIPEEPETTRLVSMT